MPAARPLLQADPLLVFQVESVDAVAPFLAVPTTDQDQNFFLIWSEKCCLG